MADRSFCRATRCVALLAVMALAGCGEGQLFGGGPDRAEDGAAAAPGGRMEEREVEAPEIFEATETGLWDGRPTFGGVWIAHPDAATPERVAIVNTATGKRITGALFRRERERPGPRFEVSSDAAQELGLIAGQPQELSVVALKMEAVEIGPTPEEIAAATATAEAQGVEDISMTPLDGTGDPDTGAVPPPPAPEQVPMPEPEVPAPAAPAPAAAAPAAEPVIQPADAPAQDDAIEEPYVQVGLFGEEANAMAADGRLRDAGIIPTVLRRGARYRIIVGPARSTEEREALMAQIQNLGFTDAYYVTD